MSATKEKPVTHSPFSSTAHHRVVAGAISLVLPTRAGATTSTELPVAGACSKTPLPEWGEVSTTYPPGRRHES